MVIATLFKREPGWPDIFSGLCIGCPANANVSFVNSGSDIAVAVTGITVCADIPGHDSSGFVATKVAVLSGCYVGASAAVVTVSIVVSAVWCVAHQINT